jgi:hypothetical protein
MTKRQSEQVIDMKSKNADEMVQSAVWLPRSLHERLKKAGGERGLGKEIRRRLEASFDAEKVPADVKTRELLDAIYYCADETARDYGRWSTDGFAFAVFKGCVELLLKRQPPKGDPIPAPQPGNMVDIIFGPDYSPKPEEVSRLYVSLWTKRVEGEKRR